MTETQLKDIIKACAKTLNEALGGLNREQLNDILSLQYIHGVSTLDKLAITKKHRLEVYQFIMRKYRWILNFEYPSPPSRGVTYWEGAHWLKPFRHFFKEEGEFYEDWMFDFHRVLSDELHNFKYWTKFDPKNGFINHGTTTENPVWLSNYKLYQEIAEKYPTLERDLTNLLQFVDTFQFKSATSSLNPENYPLYVSLYKPSREYGGPEEGGWYYTYNEHIISIKVNNFKEARVAAVKLIREMSVSVHNKIYLEKNPKCLEVKERPHYS